ncbi:hypothetical protein F8A10_16910 [Paracoccus kondratievae]|nr:hypothetical protein F8A10_16910 [Paracoccus kondratievae]
MAGVDHAGGRLLYRSCGGGAGLSRQVRTTGHDAASSWPACLSSALWRRAHQAAARQAHIKLEC